MSESIVTQLLGMLTEKEIKGVSVFLGPPWQQQYTNVPKMGLKELHTICTKFVRSGLFIRVEYREDDEDVLIFASPNDCFNLEER